MSRFRMRAAGVLVTAGLVGMAGILGGCKGPIDEQAEQRFLEKLGNTSVTVFPTVVRDGKTIRYDATEAQRVATYLTANDLAQVTVSADEVPIPGPWHMNEAQMFRESIEALQQYIAEHPVTTDYVLMVEVLRGSTEVGGVHAYVLEKSGTPAFGELLNSHQKDFAAKKPKTAADATDVLLTVVDNELKQRRPTEKATK